MNRKTEQLYEWSPLQYWRLVRGWACTAYELNQADMELLLYLEPIDYFTINDFKTGELLVSWDPKRFYRLQADGWLKKTTKGKIRGHFRYVVSQKGKRMIKRLYKIISGEETIPESIARNKIMKRETYIDKMYSQAIKKFNRK